MNNIKNFNNYSIDRDGVIVNKKTGRVLSISKNQKGYCHVQLSQDGKQKTISIHRTVWETFMWEMKEGEEINHIDGNKENNNLYNLECCTRKENMRRAVELGLIKSGVDCKNSIQVNQICVLSVSRKILNTFGSINIASKETGVASSAISSVCSGRRETAGGFKWEKIK